MYRIALVSSITSQLLGSFTFTPSPLSKLTRQSQEGAKEKHQDGEQVSLHVIEFVHFGSLEMLE